MKTIVIVVLFISSCLLSINAYSGVDVSQAVSTSQWECLHKSGYDFADVRVYCSFGGLDPNGAQTIKNARAAGIPYVDGYIFPCFHCGNPAGQVQTTVDHLRAEHADFGMLWYDIEKLAWSSDKAANQNFIKGLVDEGKRLGIKAGIYSNYYMWEEIVNLDWDYPASQGLPLWYANYDYALNYNDYRAFGGWHTPSIKQYQGTNYVCGVGIDKDWYP